MCVGELCASVLELWEARLGCVQMCALHFYFSFFFEKKMPECYRHSTIASGALQVPEVGTSVRVPECTTV